MRISIDARELLGQRTGVGRYLAELCAEWLRVDPYPPHEFRLYAQQAGDTPTVLGAPFDAAASDRFRYHAVPGDGGALWEQTRLAAAINASPPDVLFAPAYTVPFRSGAPIVATIHDISFETHPEWFTWREGLRRRWLTRQSARRAAHIIATSGFTRDEIVRHLQIPRERVSVIWHGIHRPNPAPGLAREPIVLYVGSIFNRRHMPELIRAFAHVTRTCPGARLVLVGDNRSHPFEDPDRLAAAAGIAGRVSVRRYVDENELAVLYGQATVFAFLSEYEGFGFSPLEAMAAGVPPVVGDTPVARELYGDAAVRVGVTDVPAIAAAISALLQDGPARRATVAAAEARLSRFTWSRAAAETLALLERVGRRL